MNEILMVVVMIWVWYTVEKIYESFNKSGCLESPDADVFFYGVIIIICLKFINFNYAVAGIIGIATLLIWNLNKDRKELDIDMARNLGMLLLSYSFVKAVFHFIDCM